MAGPNGRALLARRPAHVRPRALVGAQPPWIVAAVTLGPFFGRPRDGALGRPSSARPGIGRWRRCVTPRQTCPRPSGFGRNLRSKTRWFTGFCNSHQVSHFATFFIDARAEISVAESRFGCKWRGTRRRESGARALLRCVFLGACGAGVWLSGGASGAPSPSPARVLSQPVRGSFFFGAPTMILPQVHLRKPCYDFSFL